ncbi:hypothetical protein K2173_005727 [Erythroxylum novogranatense]|uniref:Zinc finger PHD-type domain-containing protein n=1 Tax=Erythroxylum novogranatense TaxID=1862640 RepID=A0AAV8SQK7_9ROSI|nr:hypothetical protein K2173_005727 [Erythroxylum novogranatense]
MEVAKKRSIRHFSHEHTLELALSPSATGTCHGCNTKILPGKEFYTCKTCSFSLHWVCSSMPSRARHPSHPSHHLDLLDSNSSANNNFKCKACDQNIIGFYYSCTKCSLYYHILCSTLPLSVVMPSHPHKLKMEFTPPYNFSCDVCHIPSHKGWLYRCRFCEFDTHISCAISNQKAQPVPQSDALRNSVKSSPAAIAEISRRIDNQHESNELMQLLMRKFPSESEGKFGQQVIHSPTSGLSEKSSGPKGELSSTMLSEDLTIPSYQFSDFCFSIDIRKPYSDPNNNGSQQTLKEASYQDQMIKIVPQIDAKIKYDNLVVAHSKALINSQPVNQRHESSNRSESNSTPKGPENRSNQVSLSGRKEKKKSPNGHGRKPSISQQSYDSDSVRLNLD